jgi:hypothetical protein
VSRLVRNPLAGPMLRIAIALLPALAVAALAGGSARADQSAVCSSGCDSLPAGVSVDPASYKLWPSGARTLLDTTWAPASSVGVFALLNSGATPSPPFTLGISVEDHNPAGEALLGSTSLNYAVPALDPGQSVKLGVPLDYSQCDIYIVVAPGSVHPTVLRAGDPAAC